MFFFWTIYKFCKDIKCTEGEFYEHFGSFEGLKQHIWIALYESTVATLHKDKDFENYPNKDKMLSFFYTMFGNLTANRSYVLFVLKEHAMPLKNLEQLKELRIKIMYCARPVMSPYKVDYTIRQVVFPSDLYAMNNVINNNRTS